MAEITAAAVKQLRQRTGLPLMDCKQALTESGGDEEAAIRWLRERGAQVLSKRGGRETAFGRFGQYTDFGQGVGTMVELMCESAPVAQNDEFVQLASDLAQQLALGPAAPQTVDELLDQPSPSKPGSTLREQKDELFNRIREVFNVGRMVRIDGPCAGYVHHAATVSGVLLQVSGGNEQAARDICMHIAAMRPTALKTEELDPAEVEKERAILREQALQEGKPEKIVDKMVEGRLRSFYAERVLSEQPFVKDDKLTVAQYAQQHGMELVRFVHWELAKES